MGHTNPIQIHPQVLRELAGLIVRPLSIILDQSWWLGEVPKHWKKANAIPVFRKGKKEDPGNYKPNTLTSIPGKVVEQLILDTISRHIKKRKVIRHSQHGSVVMLDQPDKLL